MLEAKCSGISFTTRNVWRCNVS